MSMETDLFGDVPQPLEDRRAKYHEERFWQLNTLITEFSQTAWKYLITVNGGGAAAILAFIGSVESIRKSAWPYLALASFMLGLIFVGFALAHIVHKVQSLQDNWKLDVNSYYQRKITWSEVLRRDNERVKLFRWLPWALGWGAFMIFVFGVAFTAWKLSAIAA